MVVYVLAVSSVVAAGVRVEARDGYMTKRMRRGGECRRRGIA